MSRLFTVAIIGRPNTGKSTLFNRLVNKRVSVTDDLPGVTRDRVICEADIWNGKKFRLIDTGGFEEHQTPDSPFVNDIVTQIHVAIDDADLIFFVVDGREGFNPLDKKLATIIRKIGKETYLVVNKVDNQRMDFSEFHKLGFKNIFSISSVHGLGIAELLDATVENIPEQTEPIEADPEIIRVSIAGRPNTGKSTLANAIVGEKRLITSDIPGTTRDAVEIPFENEFGKFNLVDTAGIRRHAKLESRIESFSVVRSKESIDNSDVSLLVIDGSAGITSQDKRVSELIVEAGAACIIVINKADLLKKGFDPKDIYQKMPYLSFAPIVSVSAMYDKDFSKLFKAITRVVNERKKVISTSKLNVFLNDVLMDKSPPMYRNRDLRLKYMIQAKNDNRSTPRFIIFANYPDGVHPSFQRYLIRRLREAYTFEGNPVELIFKKA